MSKITGYAISALAIVIVIALVFRITFLRKLVTGSAS